MKTAIIGFLLLLQVYRSSNCTIENNVDDIRNIIIQVNSYKRIAISLNHYYDRKDSVFFKIEKEIYIDSVINTIRYNDNLNSKRVIYKSSDEYPRKPTVFFNRIDINNDSADVVMGLDIEGIVGRFKLAKKNGKWSIIDANVYQI